MVGCAYNALGNEKNMALLDFHAVTGCDLIGRLVDFRKASASIHFLKPIHSYIKDLLHWKKNDDGLKEEVIDGWTQFLLDLYQPKRPSNINTLRQKRWYLFSKFQYNFEKLPPTSSAISFAIYRSHLVCNTWKKSLFPALSYLNPEEYGRNYNTNNNSYEAVMTDQLAAPKHIVGLCICKCKMRCKSLRCSCKKNNLVCNEMCMSNDCKSFPNEELIINESWGT